MKGLVATFYSYKGGVGRTFALANAAVILAQWGLRVLAVDWDIEAPGLDSYFRDRAEEPCDGVIEFLIDCRDAEPRRWSEYASKVALPDCLGSLHLMPAAKATGDYARAVQELNWEALYRDHDLGRHLETLRQDWIDRFDIVLLDSRTGVTDFSGVTTVQLPDLLLFFFTANHQSLEGCCDVARRAVEARKRLPVDRPTLVTVPIPARFELRDEYDRAVEWRKKFTETLAPFFTSWVPSAITAATMVDHLLIPYVPRWSFGEDLAALVETESPINGIRSASYPVSYAIETIAALLADRARRLDLFTVSRDEYVSAARAEIADRLARQASGVPSVFISHRLEDRHFVLELSRRLIEAGLSVLNVDKKASAEQGSIVALQRLVANASLLVFVVGRQVSRLQTNEAEFFIRSGLRGGGSRRIIPVVLPSGSEEYRLTPVVHQYHAFEIHASTDFAPQIARLVSRIVDALPYALPQREEPELRAQYFQVLKAARSCYQSGKYPNALKLYWRAIELARHLLDQQYSLDMQVRDLATALEGFGNTQRKLDKLPIAQQAYEKALAAVEQAVLDRTDNVGWMSHHARLLRKMSETLRDRGELRSAISYAQRSQQVSDAIALLNPRTSDIDLIRARSRALTGEIHLQLEEEDLARSELNEALDLLRESAHPARTPLEVKIMNLLGSLAMSRRKPEEADHIFEAALQLSRHWAEDHPKDKLAVRQIAVGERNRASALRASGNYDSAIEACYRCIEKFQHLLISDPGDTACRRELALSQEQLGDTLRLRGLRSEAIATYRQAATIAKPLAAVSVTGNGGRHLLLRIYAKIVRLQMGREARDALKYAERCRRIASECLAADPADHTAATALIASLTDLGLANERLDNPDAAIDSLMQARSRVVDAMANRSDSRLLDALSRIEDALDRLQMPQ